MVEAQDLCDFLRGKYGISLATTAQIALDLSEAIKICPVCKAVFISAKDDECSLNCYNINNNINIDPLEEDDHGCKTVCIG